MTLSQKLALAEAVMLGLGVCGLIVWWRIRRMPAELPMDDDELGRRMADWGV